MHDCLIHGVATIINAHASLAEWPNEVVLKLPDEFTDAELTAALERLRSQQDFRQQLGLRAQAYVRTELHPVRIAQQFRDAVEHCATQTDRSREEALLAAIADIDRTTVLPSTSDLGAAVESIAQNRLHTDSRQLLLDISSMENSDPRMADFFRTMALHGLSNPPEGFRLEPVVWRDGAYFYARAFTQKLIGIEAGLVDTPIEIGRRDVLVRGCEPAVPGGARDLFTRLRAYGVELVFVLEPGGAASHEQKSAPRTRVLDAPDCRQLVEVADKVLVGSQRSADELLSFLAAKPIERLRPLKIGCLDETSSPEDLLSLIVGPGHFREWVA